MHNAESSQYRPSQSLETLFDLFGGGRITYEGLVTLARMQKENNLGIAEFTPKELHYWESGKASSVYEGFGFPRETDTEQNDVPDSATA